MSDPLNWRLRGLKGRGMRMEQVSAIEWSSNLGCGWISKMPADVDSLPSLSCIVAIWYIVLSSCFGPTTLSWVKNLISRQMPWPLGCVRLFIITDNSSKLLLKIHEIIKDVVTYLAVMFQFRRAPVSITNCKKKSSIKKNLNKKCNVRATKFRFDSFFWPTTGERLEKK